VVIDSVRVVAIGVFLPLLGPRAGVNVPERLELLRLFIGQATQPARRVDVDALRVLGDFSEIRFDDNSLNSESNCVVRWEVDGARVRHRWRS
jgi:hypothetical protein